MVIHHYHHKPWCFMVKPGEFFSQDVQTTRPSDATEAPASKLLLVRVRVPTTWGCY